MGSGMSDFKGIDIAISCWIIFLTIDKNTSKIVQCLENQMEELVVKPQSNVQICITIWDLIRLQKYYVETNG